jgi:enoyl-CoA hydratase
VTHELPSYSTVTLERDADIVWLTLNRPERLNAMNAEMLEEFSAALGYLEADPARVVVIRGAGRSFCSGFDVAPKKSAAEHREPDSVADYVRLRKQIERFMAIWDFPKPVIAAVHGHCLAGATQLVSCCDMAVVAEDASIGMPEIPMGGGYITPFWVHLVGVKRAKQMSFEPGSKISGTTAAEWGWANYAVPAEQLQETVRAHAKRIARTPGPVLRLKKMSLNRTADIMGFRNSVLLGAETDALLHLSEPVQDMRADIRSLGLKAAIQKFRSED